MGKIDGIILLVFGCIIAFLTIAFIIGAHFGMQYGFFVNGSRTYNLRTVDNQILR